MVRHLPLLVVRFCKTKSSGKVFFQEKCRTIRPTSWFEWRYCILDRYGTGASGPRGGCARDFVNFRKKIHASRARRGRARLTVYPPRIQIRDVARSIFRSGGISKSLSTMGYSHFFRKTKKKKFCSKCFDPYIKSCTFAMRSCSTKYGSKKKLTVEEQCVPEFYYRLGLLIQI